VINDPTVDGRGNDVRILPETSYSFLTKSQRTTYDEDGWISGVILLKVVVEVVEEVAGYVAVDSPRTLPNSALSMIKRGTRDVVGRPVPPDE